MPRLNPGQREQAIGRVNAGRRPQVVANAFNCNIRTIQRLRERYNATNSPNDRPRTGRPRVTTLHQDRYILRQHRFLCATHTPRQTIYINQRQISEETVRRRLNSRNFICRRPARGPFLTPRHRRERLKWATHRQNWRHQQWRTAIFSDESRYCISTADGRTGI
ncbi:unnamed protein product [Mytilus coruscus]|uniref:Transposase Tc1-like domain-containing protein n=1 Tax=Mytilus coruscus TaxID=42192 RepID=A0A6J7ZZE2_MYTCO|nr:unnamed protein product [Mytilus coruscus]